MKKYVFAAFAASAMGAAFISCSHDDFYETSVKQSVVETYEKAFIEAFGQPAPDQEWGFGTTNSAARSTTRTITVNGDAYDKFPSAGDVAAYFPTEVPEGADEVSELETLYVGQEYGEADEWGNRKKYYSLYDVYMYKITEGYNLKITSAGTFDVGGCQNSEYVNGQTVYHYYNVYVDVPNNGEVIINRPQDSHFNLYIIHGNVKLGSTQASEWSSNVISVSKNATFTDYRDHIAANGGVRLFNKGTVYATNTTKYDIGNFCSVYNEGKFIITGAMTYSPGDANDSYFMNLGDDAELTAPSMTLNSTGNFFNSGKVTITGETYVTQARLYWVNAGHYTTGSMIFSAKNTTFYNYCQLIVEGNAHMYDGEFNLMPDSYTEAGTAEFDNFFINMYGDAGIHVKGNVSIEAQGDGTFQGFKDKNDSYNNYVLIDGKVTIASHKQTLSIEDGITYSINQMEIIKAGQVVTEEQLKDNGDGDYPVTVLEGTECPYGSLTVTPNTNSCGATWRNGDEPTADIRVIAEDLTFSSSKPVGQGGNSDFDFNDVVFDVTWITDNEATITLQAAGGTLPLTVGLAEPNDDNYLDYEVHEKFGVAVNVIVNTGWSTGANNKRPVSYKVTGNFGRDARNIPVFVKKSGEWIELKAEKGVPASKIGVKPTYEWCDERDDIREVYPEFPEWVQNGEPVIWWEEANAGSSTSD